MHNTPHHHAPDTPNDPIQLPLEMAYVLFMDIVAYSRLATDTQQQVVNRLQRVVRETPEFQRAVERNQLIGLPTGDGMALVFFGDPQSPVQCAVEVSLALKNLPKLPVRIGMHAGPVYRTVDIAGKENVAGDGINMAQRVMDCGDAGHILVSKALADVLRQLSGWTGALTDLGEVSVKHGVLVHVFNLQIKGVGNPSLPLRFQKASDPQHATRRPKIRVFLAAALLLLVASAVLAFVFRSALFPRLYRKPTVAVLRFDNMRQTPDTDWAATELTEMVTTELGAGETIHTVPGETVARVKREMALQESVTYGRETLQRLHKALGCDYVVYGSMDDPGGKMGPVSFNVHLQDASSGDMVTSISDSESEQKLSFLAQRVGNSLRAHLNAPEISPTDRKNIENSVPANPDARKAYLEGLLQLRSFDLLAARDSFLKSIASEGAFPLSHAYLAEVWFKLGYDDRSKSEAKQAFELSHNLLRENQLVIEARYRESVSEWDKAVDLYRSLWNFSQAQPEYALRAAEVQVRAGKANDALATLAELRKKAPDSADDPRIDLREAEAYESLGDARKEVEAAKNAAEKARTSGARLLEAESQWRVCGDLTKLGDASAAAVACQRSIDLATAVGDQLRVARALTNLGNLLASQGNPTEALSRHRQALEIARKLGSQRDVAGALQNIGDILSLQGDHAAAEKSYLDALQVAADINDRSALLGLQNDIAGEKESLGDFTAARDYYQKSLDTALALGDQAAEADARSNLAQLQSLQGDLPVALENIQRALQLTEQLGLKNKSAMVGTILGDVLLEQGELEGAEKAYRSALAEAQKLGDKMAVAGAQLALGNLAIEKEDWVGAAQLAQSAAAEFNAENNRDMQASAQLTLARAAIGQKKYLDAQSVLAQAESLKSLDPAVLLPAALTSARVLACTGKLAAAQAQASEAQARAKQLGLVALQFRAALAIGEFGLCGAPLPQSRSLLHSLEVTAAAKGYRLIEKQAQHALSQLR